MPITIWTGFRAVALLIIFSTLVACGDGSSDPNAAAELLLLPTPGTTIGVDQDLNVFAAYKAISTNPYPQYVDPAQVTFTSTSPAIAAVSAAGIVRGIAAGSTTITARYQTHTAQISITVAGLLRERSVAVSGQGIRKYSVYEPAGVSGARPLLLALHGGGGSAMLQASSTMLAKLAADKGIYLVFPNGTGFIPTHNAGACCGTAKTQNIDDVAYISAILDAVETIYTVDPAKIFASGFSNGGMMSHRLACALSNRLAGIVAVGGASAQFDQGGTTYYACNPARPIPVLHIHATNDRNYPYNGGPGDGLSGTNYYSVDATLADWRARNNVAPQAVAESVTPTTTCYRFDTVLDSARPSAPVALCRVDPVDVYDPVTEIVHGGGHSWPGGNRSPSPPSDTPVADFNANTYLWGFLAGP
jgi:polyhydroxybutyrate depolymerase